MTTAYWCLIVFWLSATPFALVPQLPGFTLAVFREPRPRAEKFTGWKARCNWTHVNTLEIFPFFAAGVIISLMAGAPQTSIDNLALAFIGSRVLYTIIYIAGFGIARTTVWTIGVGLIIAMFFQAV